MKYFLSALLICSLMLVPGIALEAQQGAITVTGVVLDETGQPLVGAAVFEDGTQTGAVTDLDGRYSIRVRSAESVLRCESLGFSPQKIKVGGKSTVNFNMTPDNTFLDEAVVVGYGVQRKESVVGAITQIKTEDIVNSGMTNVTQAIAGKLSGVLTMQTSGAPGANDAQILVRGVSSWNGSSPLVMVDGVERDFASIDPNEVASISVLKDASATAVFGAKGANGVILVTTRGGQEGKPQMKLTVSHGFNFPTLLPAHVSAEETARGWNVAMMNAQNYGNMFSEAEIAEYANPSSAINALRYPDVDWFKTLMRDVAHSTDANFNISGGSSKVRYFISMGYKNEGSIFKGSDLYKNNYSYNRFNYRANLDFNLTNTTLLSFKVGGDIGMRNEPESSPMRGMFSASTISFPAYYPEWLLQEVPDINNLDASGVRLVDYKQAESYFGNPYNLMNNASYNKYTTSNLYTDLLLKQDLKFITEGLSLGAKFSFSTTMRRLAETVSTTKSAYFFDWDVYDSGKGNPWKTSSTDVYFVEDPPYAVNQGPISNYTSTMYWEASINYDRSFNNHHVTALALFNQRQYVNKVQFPYRNQGVVGRVTYDFKHKYLFEGNLGITGSEQFAPANRYGVFPSLAVGYVISEENFWKRALPWWSKFKIRYSDGLVGNDLSTSRWLYYSAFSYVQGYQKYITQKSPVIYEDSAANLSAQWEEARKRDLGVELSWLDSRLYASVDLFSEFRDKMLVSRANTTTALVGTSFKEANLGSMKKHGLEVELGWKDKLQCGLGYDIHGMFSYNENRIVNYEDALYAPDYQKTAGKAYGGQTHGDTLVDGGFYTSVDDIHNYPSYTSGTWVSDVLMGSYKFLDYNSDGTIDKNDLHVIEGSIYPSTLYSFGGSLTYKGFEFSFLFYGNAGKYVEYNNNFELEFEKGDIRMATSNLNYWSPTNPNAAHSTLVNNGSGTTAHMMYGWAGGSAGTEGTGLALPGHTWRNADYLTLRDLYLGYTFNTKKLKSVVGIGTLSVYATANNLIYITGLLEGNPEATTFRDGFYPIMKTVQIGAKVGF